MPVVFAELLPLILAATDLGSIHAGSEALSCGLAAYIMATAAIAASETAVALMSLLEPTAFRSMMLPGL